MSYFLLCWLKHHAINNLQGGNVYLGLWFQKVKSLFLWEAWKQEQEAGGSDLNHKQEKEGANWR